MVADVAVNLATGQARVTFAADQPGIEAVTAAVTKAGYGISVKQAEPADDDKHAELRRALLRVGISALLTLPLFCGMLLHLAGSPGMLPGWLALALATPVQFWLGFGFYLAAGRRSARAPAIWSCWWRWAARPLTASASIC